MSQPTNFKLHTQIEDRERMTPIDFGVKRLKVKVTMRDLLPTFETRAPRGTDRSAEYNEHFCYKLDSRVKILTTEWNQKQQHFITHASRSLL